MTSAIELVLVLFLSNEAIHKIEGTHIVTYEHYQLGGQDTKEKTRENFLGYHS